MRCYFQLTYTSNHITGKRLVMFFSLQTVQNGNPVNGLFSYQYKS